MENTYKEKRITTFPEVALTVTTMLLFFVVLMITVRYHENVHKEIFNGYGIPSHIEYHFTSAYTIPYNDTLYYERCTDSCVSLHAWNEIIGYTFMSFIGLVFAVMILIIMYKFVWRVIE